MNRTQLINLLLKKRGGKSYLEIGCIDKADNFDRIDCQYKIGVGTVSGLAFTGSSDEYFAQHKEKFDLIFIDGDHEEEQVQKDLDHALARVAPGGFIVLHDCMPPDAWYQRPREAVKPRELWNGTVWKVALRCFNQSKFKCTLLDTDWGCGIIDTSERQKPRRLPLPEQLDYRQHYPLLLSRKTSVAAYLQQEIKLFYHLACMGNWKEVFREQLHQLKQSRFERMDMTLLGTGADKKAAESYIDELGLKANIIFQEPELTFFEKPALLAIEAYAKDHEGYVLYLHSKGVSNPADETKAKWRRLMMQELVVKREACVARLHEYDAVGVNWRELPPIPHFCGNFWYASAAYLRKLPDFNHYYENPRYRVTDPINSRRLGCEFWIGAARERPKILSLAYRNEDFCNANFWKNKQIEM